MKLVLPVAQHTPCSPAHSLQPSTLPAAQHTPCKVRSQDYCTQCVDYFDKGVNGIYLCTQGWVIYGMFGLQGERTFAFGNASGDTLLSNFSSFQSDRN